MTVFIGDLVRTARNGAGLSQRELARRAGTAQSVVARAELGETSPSWDTLTRIMAAAGYMLVPELSVQPVVDSHMLDDVARIQSLSPESRLAELANLDGFLAEARRV